MTRTFSIHKKSTDMMRGGKPIENLTAEEVAAHLKTLRSPEDAMTVAVERPVRSYDVFYGSTSDDREYGGWQGWSQHQRTEARSHREAAIDRLSNGNHTSGTRYLVVGPEYPSTGDEEELVGRTYEVRSVQEGEDYDFVYYWDGPNHYTVTEVYI